MGPIGHVTLIPTIGQISPFYFHNVLDPPYQSTQLMIHHINWIALKTEYDRRAGQDQSVNPVWQE